MKLLLTGASGYVGERRARAAATRFVTDAPGVRGVELRLANFVYGHGGGTRTSAVHVDAAAMAYVLAVTTTSARGVYHVAGDEEPSMAELATAVSLGCGRACSVRSVGPSEIDEHWGPQLAMFMTTNNRLDARQARRELDGSHAGHPSMLWDIARGSYFAGTA